MKQISILLVLLMMTPLFAVRLEDIEEIRRRTEASGAELDSTDRSLIEEYWETALNTMLLAGSAEDIVIIRRHLEEQLGTQPLSFYTSAYIAAAKRHLETAFSNVTRIGDAQKQELLEQNLMVLTAQMKSPALADIALAKIDAKNPVVRYWAVKAVTNSGVIQLLSSEITRDEETQTKILNALKERIGLEQQVEIQTMMINFAAAMNHPVAREMLLTIADRRIEAYKNWSIENGPMDSRLLIAMGNLTLMSTDAEVKRDFAHKFAQLYALVFQAYMKGESFLPPQQLEQVIGVILEVDRTILPKLLNVSQTGVLRAIQRKAGLDREYETIFGDRSRAGDLGTLYKFDYGKDAAGKAITEPPAIGQPPVQAEPDGN